VREANAAVVADELLVYAATGSGTTAMPAFLASLALTDATGSGFGGWYAHRRSLLVQLRQISTYADITTVRVGLVIKKSER
jgi:hypothetical protein